MENNCFAASIFRFRNSRIILQLIGVKIFTESTERFSPVSSRRPAEAAIYA